MPLRSSTFDKIILSSIAKRCPAVSPFPPRLGEFYKFIYLSLISETSNPCLAGLISCFAFRSPKDHQPRSSQHATQFSAPASLPIAWAAAWTNSVQICAFLFVIELKKNSLRKMPKHNWCSRLSFSEKEKEMGGLDDTLESGGNFSPAALS